MSWKTDRYRQAAAAYFIYGVIYLVGALYLVDTGATMRGAGSGGIVWLIVGAVMAIGLPMLVWMRFKWITRILALLVLVRIIGLARLILADAGETVPLPWGGSMPRMYGAAIFLAVAVVVCVLLVRAGWGPGSDIRSRLGKDAGSGRVPERGASAEGAGQSGSKEGRSATSEPAASSTGG